MSDVVATNVSLEKKTSVEGKHCWVCFATEEDDQLAQWVSPCKCRGTAKWVHKTCLQRWIDEKQQGNSSIEVSCPQCNSAYIIVYPRSDIIVKYLDLIDRLLNKISPVLAGCILIGSFYWTTVSYGALTIMLVLDQKDALNLMENSDPLLLLIGLPLIPFVIVASRFIRWEDTLLRYWRKYSTHLIGSNNSSRDNLPRRPNTNYNSPYGDGLSIIRIVCGGLIMPVISTMVGKIFPSRLSNLKRFVLGSITYLGLKGVLKLYYKQRQYLRQAFRQIKSFEDRPETLRILNNRYNRNGINNNSNNNASARSNEVSTQELRSLSTPTSSTSSTSSSAPSSYTQSFVQSNDTETGTTTTTNNSSNFD